MAQLVVRNLEDDVKAGLRRRAERHGRSMEEEVREILRDVVKDEAAAAPSLGTWIAQLFAELDFDEDIRQWRGEAARPAKLQP